MGEAVSGLLGMVAGVTLWQLRLRRRGLDESFDREAALRRFGLWLIAIGLTIVGLVALLDAVL